MASAAFQTASASWTKQIVIFDENLARSFLNDRILLKTRPRISATGYEWLKFGKEIAKKASIRIEERVGLYGGPYVPSVGGHAFSGLCTIGSFSYTYSALPEPMSVGRYCSISNGLVILDSHHPLDLATTSTITFRPNSKLFEGLITRDQTKRYRWHPRNRKPFPKIDHDVWIGRNVTLNLGIAIGTGAVIAAGSIVTKDVPAYAIVGGSPAKIIRMRQPLEIAQRLLAAEWWNCDPRTLAEIGFDNPSRFLDEVEKRKAAGTMDMWGPAVHHLSPSGSSRT